MDKMLNIEQVSELLGVAYSTASAIIRRINAERKGSFITVRGRVPESVLREKCGLK